MFQVFVGENVPPVLLCTTWLLLTWRIWYSSRSHRADDGVKTSYLRFCSPEIRQFWWCCSSSRICGSTDVDTSPAVLLVLCDFQFPAMCHHPDFNVCVCVSHTGRHHCSSCLRTTAQSGCCVTFVPAHCIITCFWYYVTYRISIAALATLWPHAASLACYFWNLLAGHARPPLSRPGSGFM